MTCKQHACIQRAPHPLQAPFSKAATPFYDLIAALYDVHLADAAAPLATADKSKRALRAAGFHSVQVAL